jgi:hypothetical protein
MADLLSTSRHNDLPRGLTTIPHIAPQRATKPSAPHPSAASVLPSEQLRSDSDVAEGGMIHRRSFLAGLATTIIAAPAIVRATSIMPVRTMPLEVRPLVDVADAIRLEDEMALDDLYRWSQWARGAGQLIRPTGVLTGI